MVVHMTLPVVLKISEACSIARIGRTRLYEAIKTGSLRARKHGKSTLIMRDDLLEWLNDLPALQPKKLI
jgi:excisionase family DNA binding protein